MHYLGDPRALFKKESARIITAVSANLYKVTDELYSKELIPHQTKQEMLVPAIDNNAKASKLLLVVEEQLECSSNPGQYLFDFCQVLINQQQQTLTEISVSILEQLGKYIIAILFCPVKK